MGNLLNVGGKQGGQQLVPVSAVAAEIESARDGGILPGPALDSHGGQVRQGQQGHVVRAPEGFQQALRLVLPLRLLHMEGKGCCLRLFRLRALLGGKAHFFNQLVEFQAQEHLIQLRLCRPAQVLRRVELQGRVGNDGGQAIAHPGIPLPLGQPFEGGGLGLCVRHGLIEGIDGLVFLHQGHGGLFSDALYTGDIVGAVPHEGLQVDDMDGVEAVGFPEALRRHILSGGLAHAGGNQLHLGLVRDELETVLVPGDRHARPAGGLALPGDGADKVVRLISRQLVAGYVHGVQDLLQHRHLLGQLLGHALALGLVALVFQVAEGGLPAVEGDAQSLRLLLLQQPLEGGDEAVDGVGIQSVPGGQGPDAVKGAVDDAVAVDDHQLHKGSSCMSECFYGRVYHILGRLQRFSYVTIHKRFPLCYTLPVKSSGRTGTAPD